jgi:hypothetical protein
LAHPASRARVEAMAEKAVSVLTRAGPVARQVLRRAKNRPVGR